MKIRMVNRGKVCPKIDSAILLCGDSLVVFRIFYVNLVPMFQNFCPSENLKWHKM